MHHHIKPNQPKLLFIRKDELLDDIGSQIQIVAESRTNEKGLPLPVLNNASERFSTQLERWINKYLDLSKSRMAAYVVDIQRKATMNGHLDWDEATIHLSFPWYWNATTFNNLSEAVHNYIVNSCLYELFSLTLTSKDPVTLDKQLLAEDAYQMIKHCCVSSLPGTARKKLHPF